MPRTALPRTQLDLLGYARHILGTEAQALRQVADRLDTGFERVVELLWATSGRIAVTGVGKSADVGRKIVGTFNSTGTRAYFLDATGAMHGDLGAIHPDDTVLVLSHSGESDELRRLLPPLRDLGTEILAITGNAHGLLARTASAAVVYGPVTEACPLALAPSTSTTVMLALGDALAFCLSRQRGLTSEQFARHHPSGSLGRQLASVEVFMRTGNALRTASADESVRKVFTGVSRRARRTGAIMLLENDGRLAGLFTDSDLARLFESRGDDCLDRPVREVMTVNPWTVAAGSRMSEALDIMRCRKISELPVLDSSRRPVGLLDITDLLALLPASELASDWADFLGTPRLQRLSA